jgi:hypothetical protein
MPAHITDGTSAQRIAADADTKIIIVAWRDRIVESHPESHPTTALDTLVWWTPILGPTATLMAHRFAGHVAQGGERHFSFGELARTFGMGHSNGRVRATLVRLERFGVASVNGHTVAVRVALPPLTARQVEQLPPYLAALHEQRRTHVRAHVIPADHRS